MVKKYFLRLQLIIGFYFSIFFALTSGLRGLPESLSMLFKIDFVWSNKRQGDLRTEVPWGTSL